MLSPYVRAASLTIPTLTQVLEAAPNSNEAGANQIKDLSAGTSQNDAATFGQLTDTANLRLRISDTSAMLRRYLDTLQAHNTRIISAGGGGGGSTGWALTGNASAVTDFLGTTNNRTMRFRTNNVERMVIDSTGRVGIGTATPTFGLDVNGTARVSALLTLGAGISFTGSNPTIGSNSALIITKSNFGAYISSNAGTADIASFTTNAFGQNTSIAFPCTFGVANTLANSSSLIDMVSTTRGILIPRMTLTQRNAIASPAAGLQVIVTGETGGEFVSMWNSSLAAWVNATSKWSTNANGINYNGGRVGIGTATPTSTFSVFDTTQTTNIIDNIGINLSNPNTATTGQAFSPPSLLFTGNAWNTTSSANNSVKMRISTPLTSTGVNGLGQFSFQRSLNNAAYTNLLTISAQAVTFGNQSLGGITDLTVGNTFVANNRIEIGTTNVFTGSSDGVLIRGSNGSNSGSPVQNSSRVRFFGSAWNGSTSTTLSFINEMRSVASSTPSSILTWANFSGAGPALTDVMFLRSTGELSLGSTVSSQASAKLDIQSTTQGVLFPRMTTVQKLAIGSPAAGLQVYDTTLNQMSYYNGTTWVNF
jgi:hypothetical protein